MFKLNLKIVGISFVLMFVSLMILGANSPDTDKASTTVKKESTAPKKEKVKLTPEQIAKQKADAEAKAKADAAKKKAEEVERAKNIAKVKAEREAKAKADVIKKKEAADKKAHKEYQDWIESHFSLWDGSIPQVNKMIKQSLNDPDSFKHDETTYEDLGFQKGFKFLVNFRAKNGFGGVMRYQYTGKIDYKTKMITGHFVQ